MAGKKNKDKYGYTKDSKGNRKEADYNGKFDGSTERVMTRKMTDKGGNMKKVLVPESSKPHEAFQFFKHYEKDLK